MERSLKKGLKNRSFGWIRKKKDTKGRDMDEDLEGKWS
jgi:hypothetical protein